MKKLRIYLDTSVINFLFADDAPDFKSVSASVASPVARQCVAGKPRDVREGIGRS